MAVRLIRPYRRRMRSGQAGLLLFGQNGQRIDSARAGRGLDMGLQRNGFEPRPARVIATHGSGLKVRRCALEIDEAIGHGVRGKVFIIDAPLAQAPGGAACSGEGRSAFESSHAVTRRSR